MLKKRLVGSLVAASLLLSAVPLSKVPVVRADDTDDFEIAVNSTNFPGSKMLQVAELADEDNNGVLTASEIEACKKISLPSWNITDLTGIEYFYALEELNVDGNELTTLDLSENTSLKVVSCMDNELTSLTLGSGVRLQELYCNGNQLTALDLSYKAALVTLDCSDNQLISLDVSHNPDLHTLICYGNSISKISITNCGLLIELIKEHPFEEKNGVWESDGKITEFMSVPGKMIVDIGVAIYDEGTLVINSTNFPDNNFRKYILENLDLDGSRTLSQYEINDAWSILVPKMNIKDLTGIEYFTALEQLDCSQNKLTTLDVSKNTKLVDFNCSYNQLTTLDVSKNTALFGINCSQNKLTTLNLGNCAGLSSLFCDANELATLDLSTNTGLHTLECQYNKLTTLDVSNCAELKKLYCDANELTTLDLSKNTELADLVCSYNKLTTLDVSNCSNLESLVCAHNQLSVLEMRNNPKLNNVVCSDNQLTSLDLSNCPALTQLLCDKNKLTSLETSKNTALQVLQCPLNQLTSLDLSKNTALERLHCRDNQLTSLDPSNCVALTHLDCDNNQLSSLDVSNNTALILLYCYGNQISSLDVSKNTKLGTLVCGENQLTELDVSKNTELTQFICSSNQLTSLDVSKNTNLAIFSCDGNQLTSLDISNNPKLSRLSCYKNKLTDLYLAGCPILVDTYQNHPPVYYAEGDYMISATDEYWDYGDIVAYDVGVNVHLDKSAPDPVTPEPQPDTPTPEPVKDPSFEDFVERLYTVALGRASEPEGKAFWVEQVVKNGFTGADCARFFMLGAPEFLGRNLTDDEFVEVLYKTYFDRDSEPDGKAYWLGRLASGTERAVLVEEFIESVEWCNVCATYGVKSGALYHKATIPSKNAVKFATRLYTCCLGRDPEEEGLNYWSLALTNLDATGYQAASLFFTLPEFVGLKTTNEEYLTRLYTTFMGREPEADGFAYWLGLLNGGTHRNDVMKAFAGCPEFQEICNQYGIVRGEI